MKTHKICPPLISIFCLLWVGVNLSSIRADSAYVEALQRTTAGAQLVKDLKEKRPELWDQFKNLKDATDVASFPGKVGGDLMQTIPGFSPGVFSGVIDQANELAPTIKARRDEQNQAINTVDPPRTPRSDPQADARAGMRTDANNFRNLQTLNANLLADQQRVLNELAAQLANTPKGSPERAQLEAQMAAQGGKVGHTRDAMNGWGNRADNLQDAAAGRPPRHAPPADDNPAPVEDSPPDLSGQSTVVDGQGNVSILDGDNNLVPLRGWIQDANGNLISDAARNAGRGAGGDGAKPPRPPRVKTPRTPHKTPRGPSQPGHVRPPAGGMMCFVPGTVVHTPNGPVAIESVRVGQLVLSFNESSRKVEPARVLRVMEGKRADLEEIRMANGTVICSRNHRFYTSDGNWTPVDTLQPSDKLMLLSEARDSLNPTSVSVTAENLGAPVTVHNITVEGNHNYFVGPDAALCHNNKGM